MLGIETVAAGAVGGHRAGSGGKSDERAHRRIHLRQTLGAGAEAAGKGVVAAGVQNHEVDTVSGALHLGEQFVGIDTAIRDFVLALDIGVHRKKKVLALHLHAVAGVVEKPGAATL